MNDQFNMTNRTIQNSRVHRLNTQILYFVTILSSMVTIDGVTTTRCKLSKYFRLSKKNLEFDFLIKMQDIKSVILYIQNSV